MAGLFGRRGSGSAVILLVGLLLGWIAAYSLPGSHKADSSHDADGKVRELGDSINGEITTASRLNVKDGSRYNRVPISLKADSVVEFRLDGALKGTLSLLDGDNRWIAGAAMPPASDGGVVMPVTLTLKVPDDGEYGLAVSGQDATSYGPYSVESRQLEVRNDGDLAVGDSVAGFLDGASNRYAFSVEQAGLYRFVMRGEAVDAFLHLTGEAADASDDDSGGGRNGTDAQLETYLEPGTYQLEASTYGQVQQGLYHLDVESLPMPAGQTLRNGGALSADDRLTGFMSANGREYTLDVESPGNYTFDMRSDALDAYLELNGNGVALSDDDSGGNYNARIQAMLQPGTYTLRAATYDTSGAGLYTLSVAREDAQTLSSEERKIEGTGRVSDTLMDAKGTDFTWQVREAGRYAVTLRSNAMDSFLTLSGNGVDLSDDDSAGGYDARIETELQPGTYTLNASTYGGGSGPFELIVESLP